MLKAILLRLCLGSFWGFWEDIFGVVFGDSFAYLFMAPETWLPAPKAPERKGCLQTED